MEIIRQTNIKKYKVEAEPLLLKKEAANNLPLGILNQLNPGSDIGDSGTYLGMAYYDSEAVYPFIQTPNHNLILPDVDDISPALTSEIAEHLYSDNITFPGVIGPPRFSQPFAEEWSRVTGCEVKLQMDQLIYQLDQVNHFKPPQGELVKAERNETGLAAKWLVLFGQEADAPLPSAEAVDMAAHFINNGTLYFWKVGDTPVSMVNRSRKTKNGASVNAVYTPDEYKRNGYATAAVASISALLLREGFQFCSLYTDKDNPTSNHIYKTIGYYPVGSSAVYHFPGY